MKALRFALAAAAVLFGLASVAQAGARGGGGSHGGGYGGGGHYHGNGHYHGGGWGYWARPGIGLYFGGGPYWWGGWGYGYPAAYATVPSYVYGPPAVVNSTAGIVYVEREQSGVSTQRPAPVEAPAAPSEAAPPPGGQWWYLCASPRGAYPYVRECPGGWERVPAVPPGQVK